MKAQKIGALVPFVGVFLLLIIAAYQAAVKAEPDATPNQTLVSCPFDSSGANDNLSRGFYVENYPGTDLGTVEVTYWANIAGSYTISMTARDGAYDGPIIGTTQTVTVDLPASTHITTTFDFGGASVISGTIVTFSQAQGSGPGTAYYNTGPCGFDPGCTACPGVYETSGTNPPLSTIRRRSVGIRIAESQVEYSLYLPLVVRN